MPKVVSLRGGGESPPNAPNPDVISFLQELTKEAKAGRLHGLAVVALDGVGRDKRLHWAREGSLHVLALAGVLHKCSVDFSAALETTEE